MNEFFARNIPLRDALDARARWETPSEAELAEPGFSGSATALEKSVLNTRQRQSDL
jgi:hypothetical protein